MITHGRDFKAYMNSTKAQLTCVQQRWQQWFEVMSTHVLFLYDYLLKERCTLVHYLKTVHRENRRRHSSHFYCDTKASTYKQLLKLMMSCMKQVEQ